MSATFGFVEYRSFDRFEQEYIEEIQEQCRELTQDHLWWSDPVMLYDKIEYPLYLTGDSHLLKGSLKGEYGLQRSVDLKDDLYLSLVDYSKLLEILSVLSAEHEIRWKLFRTMSSSLELTIGTIDNGEIGESAIKHMTAIMTEAQLSHEDLLNTELHKEIYYKYYDENYEPIFEED